MLLRCCDRDASEGCAAAEEVVEGGESDGDGGGEGAVADD